MRKYQFKYPKAFGALGCLAWHDNKTANIPAPTTEMTDTMIEATSTMVTTRDPG